MRYDRVFVLLVVPRMRRPLEIAHGRKYELPLRHSRVGYLQFLRAHHEGRTPGRGRRTVVDDDVSDGVAIIIAMMPVVQQYVQIYRPRSESLRLLAAVETATADNVPPEIRFDPLQQSEQIDRAQARLDEHGPVQERRLIGHVHGGCRSEVRRAQDAHVAGRFECGQGVGDVAVPIAEVGSHGEIGPAPSRRRSSPSSVLFRRGAIIIKAAAATAQSLHRRRRGGGGGTWTGDLPRRRGMLPGTEEGNIDEITIMQHCYRRRVVREGGDDAAQRRRHSSSARSPWRRGCWRLVHRARTTWPGGAR